MNITFLFHIHSNIRNKWDGKLIEIKEITREVWSNPLNASFTDHGIRHSERLTDYVADILNSLFSEPDVGLSDAQRNIRCAKIVSYFSPRNFNISSQTDLPIQLQKLAAKIAFALEASIYLHDIGMQCTNSSLHEKCGFSIKKLPGNYTKTDLKKIRDFHHELSGLWLEEAFFSNNDPRLSFSARIRNIISDIDEALLKTIITACRFHSKLDVNACESPRALEEGIIHSQIIALLLRIADELDINRSRIDLAQIEQLHLKADEEFWWWYHYLLKHISVESSGIKFYTQFNSQDKNIAESATELIASIFLKKNGEILGLLSDAGFSLNVNPYHQPPPEIDSYALKIPDKIKSVFRKQFKK